jgi:hypothetical protein
LALLLRGPASLRERLHTAGARRAVDGGPVRLDGGRRRGSLGCGGHLVSGTERVQGGPRCGCSEVMECEISGWTDGHPSRCKVGTAVSAKRTGRPGLFTTHDLSDTVEIGFERHGLRFAVYTGCEMDAGRRSRYRSQIPRSHIESGLLPDALESPKETRKS